MAEYTTADAKKFITERFRAEGDFAFMPDADLSAVLDAVLAEDEKYQAESAESEAGVYDEDVAYDRLFAMLQERFPQFKMYCMRLAEDYLDFAEQYLVSIDAIEWE